MRICSLSFFLSWTCWDRKFSHTLCKSKAHCHWPASTYAVFCWSAKICLWILFLSGLWIRLMSKSDLNKNPLKMLFWFLVGKQFQIRKAFNYSIMLGLSCLLFFSFWVFISPYPEYSRKIISAVLTNSGILIIEPKIFLFWLIFQYFLLDSYDLGFGPQNTVIALPAIFFLSSICFCLAVSYIPPLPTLGWVTWNVLIWLFAAAEYVTILCHWCNL